MKPRLKYTQEKHFFVTEEMRYDEIIQKVRGMDGDLNTIRFDRQGKILFMVRETPEQREQRIRNLQRQGISTQQHIRQLQRELKNIEEVLAEEGIVPSINE